MEKHRQNYRKAVPWVLPYVGSVILTWAEKCLGWELFRIMMLN